MGSLSDHADLCVCQCRGTHPGQGWCGDHSSDFFGRVVGPGAGQAFGDYFVCPAGIAERVGVAAGVRFVEADFWRELAVRYWFHYVAVYRLAGARRWKPAEHVEDWNSRGLNRCRRCRELAVVA